MDFTPMSVSTHLYSGISNNIDRLINAHNNLRWGAYESYEYLSLFESLEWYNKYCVISSKYLQEEMDKLILAVEDKYFHYNMYTHHHFTVKYKFAGMEEKTEYNHLLDRRQQLPKVEDIQIGKTIRYKGILLRIVEVFESIDKELGRFIAETISVKEQVKMRKGGY